VLRRIYRVPERLRPALSRGYGFVVEGSDRGEVIERVISVVRGRRVWSVGDVVTKSFIEAGYIPSVAVIDRATLREERVETSPIEEVYRRAGAVIQVSNPRGSISSEAIEAIKSIANRASEKFLVVVEGEEDLLSLIIAGVAGYGEVLVYGVPGRGVAVVEIEPGIRSLALSILEEILGIDYGKYFKTCTG